jgi:glycerate kinase
MYVYMYIHTAITDAGLAHLQQLPLQHLDLSGTAITEAGLAHLQQLPMQHLDLCFCNITDAGLTYFNRRV